MKHNKYNTYFDGLFLVSFRAPAGETEMSIKTTASGRLRADGDSPAGEAREERMQSVRINNCKYNKLYCVRLFVTGGAPSLFIQCIMCLLP